MRYWQRLGAKRTVTCSLLHLENECQWSFINLSSCIFGNPGIAQIFEHIPKLLTALIGKSTIYQRQNTESKIINIANCKTCKNKLFTVEYTILTRHYYQTAKPSDLDESTDRPGGRPTDNQTNSDSLGDFHRTVPELTVQVYWQPRPPIWQRLALYLDPDLKWCSRTVANTRRP